jgi:ABC-2 type transport system permease protein
MNFRRTWAMARKEALQLRRDPRSLLLAFLLPVALLLFFGYAISFDVKNIGLGVLDECGCPESRELVDAFARSGYFTVTRRLERPGEVERVLGRGQARLVLAIPPDFSRELAAGRPAPVQVVLDGGDANTATIAQNYALAIVAGYSARVAPGTRSVALTPEARVRVWFNETLESRNSIVPGLVAIIMSIIAALLTALTIAREWERGTMEQLAATPVARAEVIAGKMAPYVAIGLFDVALAVTAGLLVFDVPLRGSALLLGLLTLLFLVGALGLGIFISAALKSQVLATQVAIVATYLPALLLSGFIFPIATMPLPLKLITYVVPARYYVAVTRGIFQKGVGLPVLWGDALAMLIFAAAGLTLALRAFRKELA